MSSWAEQALPWFQVFGTVATVAAAVAAWRSANAARFTARTAGETSRHATEALSRVTMPTLEILLSGGDDRSRKPQQMTLYVRNDAPHPGVIVATKIERTDGHPTVTMVGPPVRLGTPQSPPDNAADIRLSGPIFRLCPDAQGPTSTEEAGHSLAIAVDFTDAAGLVRWRQHLRFYEKVSFPATHKEFATGVPRSPFYTYDWWDRPEPEAVPDGASSTARPPGWVRSTWYRVW